MASSINNTADLPSNYSWRIKNTRDTKGLTQAQFSTILGVSYASVNRWENGQARPKNLAWQRIIEIENSLTEYVPEEALAVADEGLLEPPSMDFSANPDAVSAVAEATRLSYGHLFNPAFATEVSLIDPLPHQRIAVYERMLGLAASLPGKVILATAIVLPLWGGAHHLRHIAIDFGGIGRDTLVGSLLYAVALAGSVLAVMAVVRL